MSSPVKDSIEEITYEMNYGYEDRFHWDGALWVQAAEGVVPPNAVVAGYEGEVTYIGRAKYCGGIVPGRVIPSKQACFVFYDGLESPLRDYQVLCGHRGEFVRKDHDRYKDRLLRAGVTKRGKPLYLGLVHIGLKSIVGYVDLSKDRCYIGMNGYEKRYTDYYITYEMYYGYEDRFHWDGALWVQAAEGVVPPNAVVAGYEGEVTYIGRTKYHGAIVPGRVIPSKQACFVVYDGVERSRRDYQVLCGNPGEFVPKDYDRFKERLLRAGVTKRGDPLYLGLVRLGLISIVGCVDLSTDRCYIGLDGFEKSYTDYDVYVSNEVTTAPPLALSGKSSP
ncbi:uncharacterized protein LOC118456393 [Anopheles albimanus]|uniref:uncharacterized protein LOC118456393 n=1 Tax=Anopheles albimanus TaxID=7167 RepID=UPI0016403336|nr:uncharacterized protein LOC118456393 [Anopheles albimanus]